jgi:4,5-dihydroxyphthalate decarboxylase
MRLKALLGDYPVTAALKKGEVKSGGLELDFAEVKLPQNAFKRVVRDLEFDFAELAIVTFLLAKAHGKPYRLLPAVVTARFQHPLLVFNAEVKGSLRAEQLAGGRIGQRSYSVTTATWLRGILAEDHGVDLDSIEWVTFEDPHVAEFRDPPNVTRAAPGKDMREMLLAGELDAAIMGEVPDDPRLKSVIPDAARAADEWRRKKGAIQINHMVTVKDSVSSETASQAYEMLVKSREAAGSPQMNPFGIEENRRNLEAAIDCVWRQKMIPRRFSVEELFE